MRIARLETTDGTRHAIWTGDAWAVVEDEQFTRWVTTRTPAGRWGKVEDLVGALVFLASPASNFVNGQVLFVDGGMTAVV